MSEDTPGGRDDDGRPPAAPDHAPPAPASAVPAAPSRAAILTVVAGIIAEMLEDWGSGGREIRRDTRLNGDLEFVSVDIIHLILAIEESFNRRRMNFQELLMKDNRYVDDLTVGQIADFVAVKLGARS